MFVAKSMRLYAAILDDFGSCGFRNQRIRAGISLGFLVFKSWTNSNIIWYD